MPGPEGIPSSRDLRWPILVVLDAMGEEDAILDLQDRVARHVGLPKGVGDVLDPEAGRPLLPARIARAFLDLYAAGAVEADEDGGRIWITDAGRRLTEGEVAELPESESTPVSPVKEPSSIWNWIGAVFDWWP